MSTFRLKRGDTLPIFKVYLLEPDPATPGALRAHDLTGSTGWTLWIKLSTGTMLRRAMVVDGAPTLGVLRYAWLAAEWGAKNGDGTVGGLVVGDHLMEYEVTGPAGARLTFPNGAGVPAVSYDVLRVTADLGDS